MKSESRYRTRFVARLSVVALLTVGILATLLLSACSTEPINTGSSSVEDAGLATRVNARLDSTPPTTWGVFATTDGSVLLTAPVTKEEMGKTDAEIRDWVKKSIKRVFNELPEVRKVQVMDKNRVVVGTFTHK